MYLSEDIIKKSELVLEGRDEIAEGIIADAAKKVGKTVASGAKDVVTGLAKGAIEGVLGPQDERLMRSASESFAKVLMNNGIKVSSDKVSNFLSKVLAKKILELRAKKK